MQKTLKTQAFSVLDGSRIENVPGKQPVAVLKNGGKVAALGKRELMPYGLLPKEMAFVTAYLEHGGDGAKAARAIGLAYGEDGQSGASKASWEMLSRPAVRLAIKEFLAATVANPEFITARFTHFALNAQKESDRIKSTAHLAKVIGAYHGEGEGGGKGGNTLNVQLNIPSRSSKVRKVEVNARRSDGASQDMAIDVEDDTF